MAIGEKGRRRLWCILWFWNFMGMRPPDPWKATETALYGDWGDSQNVIRKES